MTARTRAPRPSGCGRDDHPPYGPAGRPPGTRARGQAIVELAIALPVLMFLLLGSIEAGLVVAAKARQDAATIEAARWAAAHPDAPATDGAAAVGIDPGCTVTTDEDPDAGTVTVGVVCHWRPIAARGLYDGLALSSDATAAYPAGTPAVQP